MESSWFGAIIAGDKQNLFWQSRDRAIQTGSETELPLFYERHSRLSQTLATALFGFDKSPDSLWWSRAISSG
jgi:hypothetical protein